MAHWKDAAVTNEGVEMLNEWMAGRKICIVAAFGGTGTVDPDLLPQQTDLGDLRQEDVLVLVTLTVPQDLTKMTVNLKGPVIINSRNRIACQSIIDGEQYKVKFPIYDILQARKAGE